MRHARCEEAALSGRLGSGFSSSDSDLPFRDAPVVHQRRWRPQPCWETVDVATQKPSLFVRHPAACGGGLCMSGVDGAVIPWGAVSWVWLG